MLAEADMRAGSNVQARLRGQGVAYVRFALRHPGRFRLMFRDGLNARDPELTRQAHEAFSVLANAVRAALGLEAEEEFHVSDWPALVALWSAVHGYAHLAIAGRFDLLGGQGRDAFIDSTLEHAIGFAVEGVIGNR